MSEIRLYANTGIQIVDTEIILPNNNQTNSDQLKEWQVWNVNEFPWIQWNRTNARYLHFYSQIIPMSYMSYK